MSAVKPRIVLKTDEYRWSLASRCPRQAVLHRRKADARGRTTREQRILARGRLFEDLVANELIDRYGPDNVQRQREFSWPGGIGHTDVFVLTEAAALEVKSSTSPAGLIEDAILQNVGEQLFTEGCTRGGVVLIDPVDLTQKLVPVNADALRDQVDAIVEQLAWAEETGGLPDCTACTPGECALGKFCQYTDTAWEDWQPPAPEILDSTEARELTEALYIAKKRAREGEAEAAAERAGAKDIEAHLTELGVQPGVDYRIGPYKLRRIATNGRDTFSLKEARLSGVFDETLEEKLAPFISKTNGSEQYRIEKVESDE